MLFRSTGDLLETMSLVFCGADVNCSTGDPDVPNPLCIAQNYGRKLLEEFLFHNLNTGDRTFTIHPQPTTTFTATQRPSNGYAKLILFRKKAELFVSVLFNCVRSSRVSGGSGRRAGHSAGCCPDPPRWDFVQDRHHDASSHGAQGKRRYDGSRGVRWLSG